MWNERDFNNKIKLKISINLKQTVMFRSKLSESYLLTRTKMLKLRECCKQIRQNDNTVGLVLDGIVTIRGV